MLILSRKTGERIQIGENIELVVTSVSRGKVRIGINAPDDVRIIRGELFNRNDEADERQTSGPAEPGSCDVSESTREENRPSSDDHSFLAEQPLRRFRRHHPIQSTAITANTADTLAAS